MEIWSSSNIVTARKAAGLKSLDAAKQLGITPEYYSSIENGKSQPSQKLILKLAELYQQPVVFFLAPENTFEKLRV